MTSSEFLHRPPWHQTQLGHKARKWRTPDRNGRKTYRTDPLWLTESSKKSRISPWNLLYSDDAQDVQNQLLACLLQLLETNRSVQS